MVAMNNHNTSRICMKNYYMSLNIHWKVRVMFILVLLVLFTFTFISIQFENSLPWKIFVISFEAYLYFNECMTLCFNDFIALNGKSSPI